MAVTDSRVTTGRTRFNRDGEVLAAAIQVMSEQGYASTSIQKVADRVGVLKGSLYHYFRSKEELLYRILEESYEQNDKIVQEVQALELDAASELGEYLRRISFWYLNNVNRANIFFTESRHLTGERLNDARRRGREYERYFQSLVEQAQQDGRIRSDVECSLITRFLLSVVNNVRAWPSRLGGDIEQEVIVDSLMDLVRSAVTAPGRR
jgi:TetR/AcrR family transcriptional regulator, cholesterol catabolism regulator